MLLRLILLFVSLSSAALAQLQPFFAPVQASGSITVKLHPMENVSVGASTLVTFGVPFTRGSMTAAGLSTLRVLDHGVEVPAYVEAQTPWRHISNASIDGQSVRVARIQIHHTFSVSYPASENITVEWGGTPRALNVSAMEDPQQGWHQVTSGSFDAADNIMEPDVYALLPKTVLANGVLSTKRNTPFDDSITEERDDPWEMDDIEHWPGYQEMDRSFKNNFYTSINKDDPLVTEYNTNGLVDYKNESEPWLYDRASTFFMLYLKSGFLKPLREAVRATQYYRSKLYGPTVVPATSAGLFSLKAPDPASPSGGNDAMYSYAECFAYDLWLTGNPLSLAPIRWTTTTVNALAENTHWSPAGTWTERHTAFATLANVVAYEVTGEPLYRENVLRHTSDYIWHQNGAGGAIPANRLDGGLYHYGRQHGDGEDDVLVASHWMFSLTMDAMVRAYAVTESTDIAGFIIRGARFQAKALRFDDEHEYDTYFGALRYPCYMVRFDGEPDVLDGRIAETAQHCMEVGGSIAWGAYFQHLMNGVPDPYLEAAARDLYFSVDVGVNHFIRPPAPVTDGATAFRVRPGRKINWEYRPSTAYSWVMEQIDIISPPPVVTITSPIADTQFTAPASISIEVTATTPNSTITKVEFFDGATKLGEDTVAPYSFLWTGVIADTQGHMISAKATTALGVEGKSLGVPVDVRSPTRPTVTIHTPMENQVFTAPATINFTHTIVPQGSSSLTYVTYLDGYVPEYTDTTPPFSYTKTNVLHGDYEYQVMAFDILGGYDIQTVHFRVQTPTPPTVTLTAPTNGTLAVREGLVHFSANASAPGSTITRVAFRVDDVLVFEDTEAPYEMNYRVSKRWELGSHTITARAFETNGGYASASAEIQAIELPPMTVSFVSPAANANFGFPEPLVMEAAATAPGATITRVEFYANGNFAGTDTEAPYTGSYVPDSVRQWDLMARAFDSNGRFVEVHRVVNVTGPTDPEVTMTSPLNGAVLVAPAVTTLTADASVSFATITSVEFYEGSILIGEDTTAPYSAVTPSLSLGDHSFYAVANSSTGRTKVSDPVLVTVGAANSPVVIITSPRNADPVSAPSFPSVHFAATAQHTGSLGIQRVEFWLDNAFLAEDTTAPYEMDWVPGANLRRHRLVARAYDTNGVMAQSTEVYFDLIVPPIITITSPGSGATLPPGEATTIVTSVTPGAYSIDEVNFFVNGELIGVDTTAPYSLPWTPPVAGEYTIDARVRDSRYVEEWAPTIPVSAGYTAQQLWRFTHFGVHAGTGSAADDADPDGDGLRNLVEWTIGSNPAGHEPALRPSTSLNTTTALYSFRRSDASEAGTTLIARWSNDLVTWHEVTVGATSSGPDAFGVTVNVVENASSSDLITVSIPRANEAGGRLFVQLKAAAVP